MKKKLSTLMGIAVPALLFADGNNTIENVRFEYEPVDTVSLQEVFVRTNFLSEKVTPLNLTTISPRDIRLHTSSPNYVEMMQGTPGVFATSSTGNYGDATLNIRGFKQENIAILLNGIPIQGLTSGSMYWNNWMGLAEATFAVQIQKGMGGSMLADCAMGGMVNILTKRGGESPSGDVSFSATEYGTFKETLNYSTGLFKNGWSVDALVTYVNGSGYVQCADVETFSYMLNVSKILNSSNTLVFTALGSPENHNQRNVELSSEEVDKYGRDYSKNWGYLHGNAYSIARNHYYKPYFTLQHLLSGEKWNMKNSIYLAIADGGGRSTYAASGATSIVNHRTADGLIDFDAIVAENSSDGISKNIMIDYLSGHTQSGAIASADYTFNESWTFGAGLQYQYYDTWSKMNVLDLLGGNSFVLYGKEYKLGDQIGSAYGRTTHHASGYLQANYTSDRVNANLGATLFNGNYQRHDDIKNEKSAWAHGFGASVKAGVLLKINASNSVYANAGFNSRLPYASTYLASSDLKITNDIVNEKNLMAEVGWRSNWQDGGMEISGYIASWRDKTLTVNITNRTNESKENYLVSGLDALHMGVEISAHHRFSQYFSAKVYAMLADWRWKGDGDAHIYDKYTGEDMGGYKIYCNDLHVGDAPQTQFGAQLDFDLTHGFKLQTGWQCNARMYADFEPKNRTDVNDKEDAYRIPAYNLLDASLTWDYAINRNLALNIFARGTNLTDAKYIERGTDGKNHDLASFRGYWGVARTLSFGLRLSF